MDIEITTIILLSILSALVVLRIFLLKREQKEENDRKLNLFMAITLTAQTLQEINELSNKPNIPASYREMTSGFYGQFMAVLYDIDQASMSPDTSQNALEELLDIRSAILASDGIKNQLEILKRQRMSS